jgi:putative protease
MIASIRDNSKTFSVVISYIIIKEWLNKEDTLMSGERVGEVTHYFDRIAVAAILLTGTLHKGDLVHFLGHGSDFSQEITSIQVEHETIETAVKG